MILTFIFSVTFAIELLFYYLSDEITLPLFLTIILIITILLAWKKKAIILPSTFTILMLSITATTLYAGFRNNLQINLTSELLKLLNYFFLVICAVNLFKTDQRVFKQIFYSVIVSGAFLSFIGILEYTSRIKAQKLLPLLEPFHWPSLSASFFLLLAPITFSFFLEEKSKRIGKIFLFISLALFLIAWILSQKYIALLFILLSSYTFIYLWWGLKRRSKNLKISIHNILLLVLLLIFLLPNLVSTFGAKVLSGEIALNLNQFYFFNVADTLRFALPNIKNSWTMGIGPGNFGAAYNTQLTKPWTWSEFAGNELLQTLIETGLFGLIVQSILFIYLLILFWKTIYTSIKAGKLLNFSVATSTGFFLLINLTGFSLRIFPLALIFYFLCAYLISNEPEIRLDKKYALAFLLPLFFVSFLLFSDGILFNLGQRLFFAQNYHASKIILFWLSKRPKFILNKNIYVWLSALENEKKNYQQALDYLHLARTLNPANGEINYQIAALFYKQGKVDDAQQLLEELVDKNSFLPPKYYYTLSQIADEEKNLALRQKWLTRASIVYPISNNVITPITLSILQSTDYLPYLRSIYYTLNELTPNKYYLDSFYTLIR